MGHAFWHSPLLAAASDSIRAHGLCVHVCVIVCRCVYVSDTLIGNRSKSVRAKFNEFVQEAATQVWTHTHTRTPSMTHPCTAPQATHLHTCAFGNVR